jgi:hypothetical protein
MRQAGAVILINVVVFGFLIFAVDVALVLRHQIGQELAKTPDVRADLINYPDRTRAHLHFDEFRDLKSSYASFVGWRRQPFHGQTIVVGENGLRHTANVVSRDRAGATIAFFGGSTMWGTGVDDQHTIPSLFVAQHKGFNALNFGETAYVARQSLNLLIQEYVEGVRPNIVVFYDGANEVLHKCRRELGPFAHAREVYIRDALALYGEGMSLSALLYPIRQLAREISQGIAGKLKPAYFYDCDVNEAKAEQIARGLLWDWLAAKSLVESTGSHFFAILQPVAYLGAPEVGHIILEEELGRQYVAVYAKIRSLLQQEFTPLRENFADFGDVFDGREPIYIDFCHVASSGNAIVAARIGELLRLRGVEAEQTAAWQPSAGSPWGAGKSYRWHR